MKTKTFDFHRVFYNVVYQINKNYKQMKKHVLSLVAATLCILVMISCSKDNDEINSTNGISIYVAGFESNTAKKEVAKYWKNGVATSLSDGNSDAEATSIFVSGNDVYVCGYEETNGMFAQATVCWKNGKATYLTDGSKESNANSIFVSGNDIYVAGYEKNSDNIYVAMYWKNGKAVNLSDGTTNAEAHSIYVVGNDIYVSGCVNTNENYGYIKYWKNGVPVNLYEEQGSYVYNYKTSIFVSGNDVYVASDIGKYWKNGIVVDLSNCAGIGSIFVYKNDVYVSGCNQYTGEGNAKMEYWKNSVETVLSPFRNYTEPGSICIYNDTVYVAGSQNDLARYWKNNEEEVIVGNTNSGVYSGANSIFVCK